MSSRRREILGLAVPIIGGMISQNVLNLVDTAMVGTLGDAALAGVGMASFANFLAAAFITGLSAGVQAMASRRKGEGRDDETAVPLNGGLLLAVGLAVPWSLLLLGLAPLAFPLLVDDPAVVAEGVPYLQARLLGMAGVGMNFAFRGYWNGVKLSKLYMRTLVVMHVANIALNYTLIYGHFGFPALGATGAGIGTAASTYLGTATYVFLGVRHARAAGFLRGIPDRASMLTMLRLAVPAGFQQFFFAAGMTAFFWIVGKVGTRELAAANVLVNLLLVCILPGIGFGLAAATLVGQALGARDPEAARGWGWEVSKLAAGTIAVVALPAAIFPDLFLGLFLHDAETLALARAPLRLVALFMALDTVGMVLMNALLGAGATRSVMVVSVVMQWVFFLPLAYLVGPVLGWGLLGVWALQMIYRVLQSGIFAWIWQRGSWASIRV
jgi:MATE family multidrug resistance protein